MDPLRALEKLNNDLAETRNAILEAEAQIHDLKNVIVEKTDLIANLQSHKTKFPEKPHKIDYSPFDPAYGELMDAVIRRAYGLERDRELTSIDFRISEADTILRGCSQEKEELELKLPRLRKREEKMVRRIADAVANAKAEMERIKQRHGEAINQAS